ncbi:MAG TPA: Asd/ArgC dimerization domain-containing protein, partial [Kribbella sp.]
SGAGKAPKTHLLGAEVMGSASAYGVGGVHRHTPEIEQNLTPYADQPVSVSFTPVLAPMARGILATCSAPVADGTDYATLRKAYADAYADEPFIHLLPEGQWPQTQATLGANTVQLQVALDQRTGRAVVVAAMDNLTKGTAGAAVQCMNLATGLDETTALPLVGVAP